MSKGITLSAERAPAICVIACRLKSIITPNGIGRNCFHKELPKRINFTGRKGMLKNIVANPVSPEKLSKPPSSHTLVATLDSFLKKKANQIG